MKFLSNLPFFGLLALLLVLGLAPQFGLGEPTVSLTMFIGVLFFWSGAIAGRINSQFVCFGFDFTSIIVFSVFTMSAVIILIVSSMAAFVGLQVTLTWGIVLAMIFLGSGAYAYSLVLLS